MTLNIDDVLEILEIVRECKDTELHIDTGDMKLSVARGKVSGGFAAPAQATPAVIQAESAKSEAVAAPAVQTQPEAPAVAEETPPAEIESEALSEEGLVPITSNVTSVFYRKPSPDEPPFVEVGDVVEEDTIVCLLEVMKCFRQVMAETRGQIVKVCVESGDLVEEGTTMFLVRPN